MSVEQRKDGSFRFSYDLNIVPCRWCDSTDVTLYEDGGKSEHEHKKGTTEGGGICKFCGHTVHVVGIPPVPSMSMLLEIWNSSNRVD